MTKSTNIEIFPCAERFGQVMQGLNIASRLTLRKLNKEFNYQDGNNVIDLAAARKEKLMAILGH